MLLVIGEISKDDGFIITAFLSRLDYDSEVDVLYLHFENKLSSTSIAKRESEADCHSEMRDDGIILDYKGSRLVGLTILEASHR